MENKIHKDVMFGVDNIYFGKFYKIYYLLFYKELDYIIDCFDIIFSQERLVYILQKYINIYTDDYIYDSNYLTIFFIKFIM